MLNEGWVPAPKDSVAITILKIVGTEEMIFASRLRTCCNHNVDIIIVGMEDESENAYRINYISRASFS